jgi:hypothetical protein
MIDGLHAIINRQSDSWNFRHRQAISAKVTREFKEATFSSRTWYEIPMARPFRPTSRIIAAWSGVAALAKAVFLLGASENDAQEAAGVYS